MHFAFSSAARLQLRFRGRPSLPLRSSPRTKAFFSTAMGDNVATQPTSRASTPGSNLASKSANKKSLKEVRILMIHGYAQSGPLFRAKTRALEKLLAKALAPAGLLPTLVYPTAPDRLLVQDVPGYDADSVSASATTAIVTNPTSEGAEARVQGGRGGVGDGEGINAGAGADSATPDNKDDETAYFTWWRRNFVVERYKRLDQGMGRIADTIREQVASCGGQGVDGVLGFSQGGCMAGMLAAALEEGRAVGGAGVGEEERQEHEAWVRGVREANGGRPLKFAAVYSGFRAAPPDLQWLYEPKIKTPTLHVIGSLDTIVDEDKSQELVERCEDPLVVTHPGGHYVPISKQWAMPLAGFIKKCMENVDQKAKR